MMPDCHIPAHVLQSPWRNVIVIFGTEQNSKPELFSFDSGCLAAVRSLSIIVNECSDVGHSSFASVLASMINASHICVRNPSGPFIRLILESRMASLMTLVLDFSDAEPQDFADMVSTAILDLRISRCHSNLCRLLGPLIIKTWRSRFISLYPIL